jgi:hypothetical protein
VPTAGGDPRLGLDGPIISMMRVVGMLVRWWSTSANSPTARMRTSRDDTGIVAVAQAAASCKYSRYQVSFVEMLLPGGA